MPAYWNATYEADWTDLISHAIAYFSNTSPIKSNVGYMRSYNTWKLTRDPSGLHSIRRIKRSTKRPCNQRRSCSEQRTATRKTLLSDRRRIPGREAPRHGKEVCLPRPRAEEHGRHPVRGTRGCRYVVVRAGRHRQQKAVQISGQARTARPEVLRLPAVQAPRVVYGRPRQDQPERLVHRLGQEVGASAPLCQQRASVSLFCASAE